MGELINRSDAAIIGAGVIGCAIAWALAKEGRRVLLIDRAEPASAGASFGNVGHIATEQLQPLPSPRLLAGFWRELALFGGPLDIPLRRVPALLPWMFRFAASAFRQEANTKFLAPLVRCAADTLERQLEELGRRDLIRRRGHYAVWLGRNARERAESHRRQAEKLEIATKPVPELQARRIGQSAVGVWFPDTAHVLDPASVARAFASAAVQRGATLQRASVQSVRPRGSDVEISTDIGSILARTAIVCAGPWSAPFLAPFGLKAPLEAERGYHIELPDQEPFAEVPILYADHSVVVTPMASRLRASSYLEFAGLEAEPDPRKPARLRAKLQELGYRCDPQGPSWMGARPTLPDYLPGIGRTAGPQDLYYAVGHQHLGLTLAAVTAELMADLVAGRAPRFDVAPFDLRRFGSGGLTHLALHSPADTAGED